MVCSTQKSNRWTWRFRDATPAPYSTTQFTCPCLRPWCESAPPDPRGTPQDAAAWLGADHSFTLQAIMHLTETTGGLTKAVESLTEQVEQQHQTIRWMSRVLWMAGGALVVLLPIAGWLVNHRFDEILNALARGGG